MSSLTREIIGERPCGYRDDAGSRLAASACFGKDRFEHRAQAIRVMQRWRPSSRTDPDVKAYRREHCGGWHIGMTRA